MFTKLELSYEAKKLDIEGLTKKMYEAKKAWETASHKTYGSYRRTTNFKALTFQKQEFKRILDKQRINEVYASVLRAMEYNVPMRVKDVKANGLDYCTIQRLTNIMQELARLGYLRRTEGEGETLTIIKKDGTEKEITTVIAYYERIK